MKISTFLAASILAAGALAGVAAAKTPVTHEAIWMMKRVGAPVVSPDGKWVIYSVVEPSYETDKTVSDLWLVPTGGGPPKRLTHTKAGEGGAAWSPDSTKIAFTTKREGDEVDQVYVLDVLGGGEARRVTSLSTAAANPKWRPDGQAILFETMVWPGAMDDEANRKAIAARKARKYNVRTYEHFPIRYWNEWLDERLPTLEVVGLEPGAKPRDILSPTRLAHTPGFSGPEGETSISLSPIWSPDGKEVIFSATVERWNSAFSEVNYQLYRLPADGGEATPVTPEKGGFREPTFSADGKSLYFDYNPRTEGEVYSLARFSKVAWPAGGAMSLVARDFDREPERFAITPDGKTAYILVPEAGKTNLYSVPTAGGKPALVMEPATGGYGALSIPQKAAKPLLIANFSSSVSPQEIVRIDPLAKKHENLTNVDTAAAANLDWAPPIHFDFVSAGGRKIHNMIILPPNFDPSKKYPLLVFIHGGAASMNADQISLRWNYHLLTAAGYLMLMSDYTGSTGYGEAFARAIKLDPLKTPGLEIDQAVNEALKRYSYIDGTKMCALGASYGGHLVNWLEATTTRYKCLVSHAGEVDLETQWGESDGNYGREVTNGGPPWEGNPVWRDQSPITYAKAWKTPMLLSIGERDFRVPIGNTLENWATLQRMKVPSRLLVWPDAWHWILKPEDSRHFYQEVDGWLAHYLKGGPPPPAPGTTK
ncbi:S9 family peptidase [Phenylobacterium sp.]|jgi:dipeptidyl aminopeptidase/acylaminoacyl peptidase|uniref:S9 family peptidase n=1 Tax=Phenylobacterium sp. TaxID=1871053 RepID=UPI002F3FE495